MEISNTMYCLISGSYKVTIEKNIKEGIFYSYLTWKSAGTLTRYRNMPGPKLGKYGKSVIRNNNRRYSEIISTKERPSPGTKQLHDTNAAMIIRSHVVLLGMHYWDFNDFMFKTIALFFFLSSLYWATAGHKPLKNVSMHFSLAVLTHFLFLLCEPQVIQADTFF